MTTAGSSPPESGRGFEIQGHRGARGLFPENTVAGFERAIGLGVRVIELDVAVTADDVAVVFHDAALNPDIVRAADGEWIAAPGPPIRRLTRTALTSFDVGRLRPGSTYAARYPDQVPCDGARIPTLAEVFALTVPAGVRADIELKTLPRAPKTTVAPGAMAEIVLATAERGGALGLVDVRSFDWRGLRAVRARRPEIPLTFLTSGETVADPATWWDCALHGSVPRTIAAEHATATWAPESGSFGRDDVDDAHGLGLRVVPWTVNDPAEMHRLISWGIDGLCTDRPDLAFAALRTSADRA